MMYLYNKRKGKPIVHTTVGNTALCNVQFSSKKYSKHKEFPKNGKPCKTCTVHLEAGTVPRRKSSKPRPREPRLTYDEWFQLSQSKEERIYWEDNL